jgi:branched-chain amino acid aminotransferase
MPFEKTDKIWMDGELVPWDEARVHVLTHSLHYGSGVFEGIRTYAAADGPAVFRLTDHIQRLLDSAKLIMMKIPYSRDELVDACKLTVRESGLDSCYVRPIAYLGYGEIGLNPLPCAVNVSIAVWPWGSYLGDEGIKHGVRLKVSSWRRMDPNVNPVAAKGTGIYINSSLAKVEALKSGYDEAILLNSHGFVAECTGENVFVVKEGALITPPLSSGALEGVTRDSVMTIARDLGYEVREENLLRTDLYCADEAFLTGTAAEIVPMRSVDDREIGEPGEITRKIQETYFATVHGEVPQYKEWLDYVRE